MKQIFKDFLRVKLNVMCRFQFEVESFSAMSRMSLSQPQVSKFILLLKVVSLCESNVPWHRGDITEALRRVELGPGIHSRQSGPFAVELDNAFNVIMEGLKSK